MGVRAEGHMVACRVTSEQYNVLAALRSTLDTNSTSEALRWLLDNTGVRAIIAEKVRE